MHMLQPNKPPPTSSSFVCLVYFFPSFFFLTHQIKCFVVLIGVGRPPDERCDAMRWGSLPRSPPPRHDGLRTEVRAPPWAYLGIYNYLVPRVGRMGCPGQENENKAGTENRKGPWIIFGVLFFFSKSAFPSFFGPPPSFFFLLISFSSSNAARWDEPENGPEEKKRKPTHLPPIPAQSSPIQALQVPLAPYAIFCLISILSFLPVDLASSCATSLVPSSWAVAKGGKREWGEGRGEEGRGAGRKEMD
ncbi:hypothetical protein F4775DRAFT_337384 [Biscogniauxia sp. FL1348]|nr:hypothetical protein F4775DRAFT_337384 [Biscogniauxia sp. FL1348]